LLDEFVIGEKNHSAFDVLDGIISFDKREAKTVALNRARAHIPKLRDVLEAEVQAGTCGLKKSDGGGDSPMIRIVFSIDPKQNIRINQIRFGRSHQS
jgi:hypothetical protein